MKASLAKESLPWDESEWEKSIGDRFGRIAGRYPDRVAVRGMTGGLSYCELDLSSGNFASALRKMGVSQGARVVLLMAHDVGIVSAVVGTLRCGLVCVPLRPSQPEGTLQAALAEADPDLVICDVENAGLANRICGDAYPVRQVEELGRKSDQDPDWPEVFGSETAFLTFTSGSAGKPKGVLQTHRNLLHHVWIYSEALNLTTEDRVCLLALCSSGQGVITMLCALLNGCTLCLRDPERHAPEDLPGWLDDWEISILVCAASVFRQVLLSRHTSGSLASVRLVKVGAEALSLEDLEKFRDRFPVTCLLVHTYSCTEAGVITFGVLSPGEKIPASGVAVGYVVRDKKIRILDEYGKDVAPGESGEIAVQSRFLSPGYWKNKELTEHSFQKIEENGERLYCTGDLGRILSDGQLEHLGRRDLQVKIRGVLVDLLAVEKELESMPSVKKAAVFCKRLPGREVRLCASVIWEDPGIDGDTRELRRQLTRRLPGAMVPHYVISVSDLPFSASGKLDRHRLEQESVVLLPSTGVEPRNDLETCIAEKWCQVLDTPSVGVYDHFFENGGDSLSALRLISLLSEELGQALPIELLLNHPTIAQMAEILEAGFPGFGDHGKQRPWDVELMRLGSGDEKPPLVFLPGGYASENELLVFAGLLPHLGVSHSIFGIRLNFFGENVSNPRSFRSIARRIGKTIQKKRFSQPPVIIGECCACSLAVETARWLRRRRACSERLILLDPWRPTPQEEVIRQHPPAIVRYFDLLESVSPGIFKGETHMVFAADSPSREYSLDWWKGRVGSGFQVHQAPGDHDSYIRQHRRDLAEVLSSILSVPG